MGALAPAYAEWARDPRYAQLAGRHAHQIALDAALAQWTRTQPCAALVARARSAGVAVSPVLSVEEQWRDPHYAARAIKHRVTIPVYGVEESSARRGVFRIFRRA